MANKDLLRVLQELKEQKFEAVKPRQIKEIVPIEVWLNDPFYSGPDAVKLYPYWKNFLCELFKENSPYNEAILAGSIGCQIETQRIPTTKGILSYREIKELFDKGDIIQVLSEEGINNITGAWDKGVEPTKVITFRDGSIVEGTHEHRIRAIKDSKVVWVRYDELQVGDKVIKSSKPCPLGTYKLRENEAYMLGYLTGDGWVCKDSNKIGICIGDVERYQGAVEAIYPILKEISPSHHVVCCKKGTNYCTLQISSKEYHDWLLSEGIGQGSRNKRVPRIIFKCCKEDILEYLAGLIDSDGYLYIDRDNYNTLELKSTSIGLLRDTQELLYALGIRSTFVDNYKYWGNKNALRLSIKDIDRLKELGFTLKIKYKEDILRKQTDSKKGNTIGGLKDYLKRYSGKKGIFAIRNYTALRSGCSLKTLSTIIEDHKELLEDKYLNYLYNMRIHEVEIVDIKDSESFCMDLTIQNSPTYLFNGFISHNTGKSTVAVYAMIRKLYEMSCYENLAGLYGLMKTSSIAMIYFSLSLSQAEKTGFGQLKNLIDSIPYFQKEFSRNEKINSEIRLPQNLFIRHGASNNQAIGVNLIGSILDEANFYRGESTDANTTQEASKVADLYSSILARGRSRFLYGGKNHSLSFLVSSSTHKGSFTEKRIAIAREENFAHTLVATPKLWDVKGERYSKERFYVYTGSDKLDPMIIETDEDIRFICESLFMDIPKGTLEDKCKVLEQLPDDLVLSVPIDFRDDFKSDLLKSIQDIGGVATSPSGQLFTSKPIYNKCVDESLQHPFTKETIILSTGDTIRLEDYLKRGYMFKDSYKSHYIHIDAAISGDCYGISMSHIDHFQEDDTGQRVPIFMVDFQLRIKPPKKPNEIPLSRVRQFIGFLRDVMKVNILGVSFDQAHSSESRQLLRDAGFLVEYRSVDRKDEAYLNFCNILYEHRLIDYRYKPFEEEFFNLIHYRDKRKVDHLPGYAKDVCDAKVGAIQGLIEHVDEIYEIENIKDIIQSDNDLEEDIDDLITLNDLIDFGEL